MPDIPCGGSEVLGHSQGGHAVQNILIIPVMQEIYEINFTYYQLLVNHHILQ